MTDKNIEKSNVEEIKVLLTVKTPVHIGCDEVYTPFGFVDDKEKKELIFFNPEDVVRDAKVDERRKLLEDTKSEDIVKIRRWFKNQINGNKNKEGKRISIVQDILTDISINKNKQDILRTAYLKENGKPYIPGSSIKGSIRTAYLNLKNNFRTNHLNEKKDTQLIEECLKSQSSETETDPFRLLKVSDFIPFKNVKTKIVYAHNKKKFKEGDSRGISSTIEVILPESIFIGTITLIKPCDGNETIKEPIKMEDLKKAIKSFYEERLKSLEKINLKIKKPEKRNDVAYFLQIGRYTGAEGMTISGQRSIKINLGKAPNGEKKEKYFDHSTTIWLVGESKNKNVPDLKPFSWVTIEKIANEEFNKYDLEIKEEQKKEEEKIRLNEEIREKEREVHLKEQEAKDKELEERMSKTTGDNSSYNQKQKEQATWNDILNEYNICKDMPDGEDKKKKAEIVKEKFIENGRWNVKPKDKKQYTKVMEIKKILGEN